jgi:hypothetical protein
MREVKLKLGWLARDVAKAAARVAEWEMREPMNWVIEVDSVMQWSIVCHCGSQDEAESRARYFRPMQCFSGRELRVRKQSQ